MNNGLATFYYLKENCISLIGLVKADLIKAKQEVKKFLEQTTVVKKISCNEQKTKFILKYLVSSSLVAIKLSEGFSVKGSFADVSKCKIC